LPPWPPAADQSVIAQDLGGNAAGLHSILAEAFAGDDRAGSFLSRLLGMGGECRLPPPPAAPARSSQL
jgi:hypothetical protein